MLESLFHNKLWLTKQWRVTSDDSCSGLRHVLYYIKYSLVIIFHDFLPE